MIVFCARLRSTGKRNVTANTGEYVEFVRDRLARLGPITTGRFFAGVSLRHDGVQFAMLMGNTLYLVVNDETRPKYVRMGSTCFSYRTSVRRVQVHKYYEVPAGLLENEAELVALAQEAIRVASAKVRRKDAKSRRSRVRAEHVRNH